MSNCIACLLDMFIGADKMNLLAPSHLIHLWSLILSPYLGSIWFYTVASTMPCHCMYVYFYIYFIYTYTYIYVNTFANLTIDPQPHSPVLLKDHHCEIIPHDSFLQYQCLYCNSFCARSVVPIRCVPHPRNWAWMRRRSSKDFFQPMFSPIKCRISEKGCWNCLWSRKRLGVSPAFSVFDSTSLLWPSPPVKKFHFHFPLGFVPNFL